jgi:hypothetical protein
MKLILKFFKKLPSFLNNALNVSGNKNTNSPEPGKYSLLRKKRKKIMESLSFEKRSPQSFELQRRLALLVSNIDNIDKRDLQHLEHRRYGNSKEDDLLTSYRIDFHNRDDLEIFKQKYMDYLI